MHFPTKDGGVVQKFYHIYFWTTSRSPLFYDPFIFRISENRETREYLFQIRRNTYHRIRAFTEEILRQETVQKTLRNNLAKEVCTTAQVLAFYTALPQLLCFLSLSSLYFKCPTTSMLPYSQVPNPWGVKVAPGNLGRTP